MNAGLHLFLILSLRGVWETWIRVFFSLCACWDMILGGIILCSCLLFISKSQINPKIGIFFIYLFFGGGTPLLIISVLLPPWTYFLSGWATCLSVKVQRVPSPCFFFLNCLIFRYQLPASENSWGENPHSLMWRAQCTLSSWRSRTPPARPPLLVPYGPVNGVIYRRNKVK